MPKHHAFIPHLCNVRDCFSQFFSFNANFPTLQEEQAEEGLQRHYMWPVTLPHHPDVKAYLIPHCNTLWWASNKELLHPEEHIIGAGVCAMRKPRSIELTGVCCEVLVCPLECWLLEKSHIRVANE